MKRQAVRFLSTVKSKKQNVVLCGGSGGNHVLAADLGSRDNYNVSLITNNPTKWSKDIVIINETRFKYPLLDLPFFPKKQIKYSGKINDIVSWDNPKKILNDADTIIITAPVSSHRDILEKILPSLKNDKPVILGSIFAQGGFDWIVRDIIEKKNLKLDNVSFFGFKRYPFACKPVEYGKEVDLWGRFPYSLVAMEPGKNTSEKSIEDTLKDIFKMPLVKLPSFLYPTMNFSNQILHPTISEIVFQKQKYFDEIPKFYTMSTPESTKLSLKYMREFASIGTAIRDNPKSSIFKEASSDYFFYNQKTIRRLIERIFGSNIWENLSDNLINKLAKPANFLFHYANERWQHAPTPMIKTEKGFTPNFQHRFWLDDIPHGLCVLYGMAEILNVDTKTILNSILIQQKWMGKEYLVENPVNGTRCLGKDFHETNAPQVYGVHTEKDLFRFLERKIHD